MASNTLFDQNNENSNELENLTPEQALETLVGEGKKYASPAELALAYAHANQHIGKLQNENSTFRTEMEKARSIEDVLAAIQNGTHKPDAEDPGKPDTHEDTKDVAQLIAEEFAKRDAVVQQQKAKTNVETVIKTLHEKFGDKAAALYKAQGEKLGIDLDELAAKSPQAVLAYFTNTSTANLNTSGKGHQSDHQFNSNEVDVLTKAGLEKMYREKKITREEKFRMEHEAISKVGADKFFGRA